MTRDTGENIETENTVAEKQEKKCSLTSQQNTAYNFLTVVNWEVGMCKTFWLIFSNSESTNQLLLELSMKFQIITD